MDTKLCFISFDDVNGCADSGCSVQRSCAQCTSRGCEWCQSSPQCAIAFAAAQCPSLVRSASQCARKRNVDNDDDVIGECVCSADAPTTALPFVPAESVASVASPVDEDNTWLIVGIALGAGVCVCACIAVLVYMGINDGKTARKQPRDDSSRATSTAAASTRTSQYASMPQPAAYGDLALTPSNNDGESAVYSDVKLAAPRYYELQLAPDTQPDNPLSQYGSIDIHSGD